MFFFLYHGCIDNSQLQEESTTVVECSGFVLLENIEEELIDGASSFDSYYDMDCDGVIARDDCDDNDPTTIYDMDCDGVSSQLDCDDFNGNVSERSNDADCDGVPTIIDCDDSDETKPRDDEDCDGVLGADDCDDTDPDTIFDMDCDGVLGVDDCDDADPILRSRQYDGDCDGATSFIDCNDADPFFFSQEVDHDCDGILGVDDCDDEDETKPLEDADCDGVLALEDCDDYDAFQPNFDQDCDGVLSMEDESDLDPLQTDAKISVNGVSVSFALVDGEDPLERYMLEDHFLLMKTEVTQEMFSQLMSYEPSSMTNPHRPVSQVSWHMAADFANQLTQYFNMQHNLELDECYACTNPNTVDVHCVEAMNPYNCDGYSLPTDAQWEIAARSGTVSEFWTGAEGVQGGIYSSNECDPDVRVLDGEENPDLSDFAWFCGNTEGPKDVAQKMPNGFGLFDMHGNMNEWVVDGYGCVYPQPYGQWCSTYQTHRVIRGGSWQDTPNSLATEYRTNQAVGEGTTTTSFRMRKMIR